VLVITGLELVPLTILCLFFIDHKKDSEVSQIQDQKLHDGSFIELPRKRLLW
jgi:hypothetical protein